MVAMTVWPTDASDGSVANEARWRKMGRLWRDSGIATGQGGELAPSLAGLNLTVQSGAAWVDGHYTELASTQVLTATANGLAVVRFDPAANTADLLWRDAVSVPTQSPTGTWELPIAKTVSSVMTDLRTIPYKWRSYPVAWTATTGSNTLGNGTLFGRYVVIGKTCHFSVVAEFGSTTGAGQGFLFFSLPVPAAGGQGAAIVGSCFTYIPSAGGSFMGYPLLVAPDRVVPMFTYSPVNAMIARWQATNTGATNEGVPNVAGYPVQNGASCTLAGTYEIA